METIKFKFSLCNCRTWNHQILPWMKIVNWRS